ncbi:uncharacterized protein N7482_001586 [Penicillium canariense]|uniref:Uncharacterized protein n=1 Tax=Penicillium canariense TaxID=189055 RepID=A0A9W9IG83_9EURO|nr:uncharacterized protein N7482_001586 [Penicillium canariense]KAJ5175709.1 hypothetical protein N7482_001586 [Penicillium canariense]
MNSNQINPQTTYGEHDRASQISQLPRHDHSIPASVATSVASSSEPGSSKNTGIGQSLLGVRKRRTEESSLPQIRHRYTRGFQLPATGEIHTGRLPHSTTISCKLVNDTINYLKTVSVHIASATITSEERARIHLATQSLQSTHEDIANTEEMDTEAVTYFHRSQPNGKCKKCEAAKEEHLYD